MNPEEAAAIEIYRPANQEMEIAPSVELATIIAKTPFAQQFDTPGDVLGAMLWGEALDVSPMAALQGIDVIQGRPAISAELMRALVQRAGHTIRFTETTASRCTVQAWRKGESRDDATTVTWTIQDAKTAGLVRGGSGWSKYPRAMLQARATTEACRLCFADVVQGMPAAEEVGDVLADGPPAPPPEPATTVRRAPTAPAPAEKSGTAYQRPAATPAPAAEPVEAEVVDDNFDRPLIPPSVPDADYGAPEAPQAEADDDGKPMSAARRIAMLAREADVDRAAVATIASGGRTHRASDLKPVEVQDAIDILQDLGDGTAEIVIKDGAPVLRMPPSAADDTYAAEAGLEQGPPPPPAEAPGGADNVADAGEAVPTGGTDGPAPPAPPPEPSAAHLEWDAGQWRIHLKDRRINYAHAVRRAIEMAERLGEPRPGTLTECTPTTLDAVYEWTLTEEARA